MVKWLKDDSQPVDMGKPILRVQTEKMAYEVTSPASGILRIVTPERQRVAVDTLVGWVLASGESFPEAGAAAPAPAAASTPGAVKPSPAARRLAQEHGIDISQVPGTGPEGRIVETDVARFWEERPKAGAVRATPLAQRIAQEHGSSWLNSRVAVRAAASIRRTCCGPLRPKRRPPPPLKPFPLRAYAPSSPSG